MKAKIILKLTLSLIFFFFNSAVFANTNFIESRNIISDAKWSGLFFGRYQDEDLALNLMLDPTFSNDEQFIIKDGMKTFMERSMNRNILNCAYINSTKDFPLSEIRFREQLYDALSFRKINDLRFPGFAYIEKSRNSLGIVGTAGNNYFYDKSEPSPGYKDKHNFYISINPDFLNVDSGYGFSKNPSFWAGVIAHLFLHNLGYNHPNGSSGSFIAEYSNCISLDSTDGTVTEKLTDTTAFAGEL